MKRLTHIMTVGALLLVVQLFVQHAGASCGVVEVSKGDVKITSGGKTTPTQVGAKICSGDTIIAGVDSRAKLRMEDGNELNISPSSTIIVENYQFNAADNKKKVMLNVLMGKVRATTPKEGMYGDKAKDGTTNTFQVKTKSAVAGVRGTDFLTGFDPKTNKSEVVTFRGKVEVGQPGPGGQVMRPVMVGAGQKTEAVAGQAPATPKMVPPSELKQMNSETKADTATGSDKTSGGSSEKGDKKDGDKKDGDKKSDSGGKSDGSGDKSASGDKSGDKSGSGDKAGGDGGGKSAGAAGSGGGDDGGKSSGGGSSAGNSSGSSSGSDSGGGSAKGPGGNASAGGSPSMGRAPASAMPGGSMISAGDASTGAIAGGAAVNVPSTGPLINFAPPPTLAITQPKVPDLPPAVTNVIQNGGGNTKLKVIVCVNGRCP